MKHALTVFLFLVAIAGPRSGLAQSQVQAGDYQENATFLSRRFLTDSKLTPALTDDFLARTNKSYKTPFLFPNGGLLSSRGVLDHAPGAAAIFLGHVAAYETAYRATFTILPFLNGYSLQDTAHAAGLRLDLEDPAVRKNIVAECGRYVSAEVAGSYVKGSRRSFDGIMIDIEPAGDSRFYGSLKMLVAEIRNYFDRMGLNHKKIAVAAPQHTLRTPKPNWAWDSSDYHYMARYVDYMMAMTYDSGLKSPEYQSWIDDQTAQILRAVSGAAWNFDSDHPQPKNGVKVFVGLPGYYTKTEAHNPEIENVSRGAPGILQALSRLSSSDRTSLSCFQGAAMFTHDGGAAGSIFARYDKDWWWWLESWLGAGKKSSH